jgi:hypothetical protein
LDLGVLHSASEERSSTEERTKHLDLDRRGAAMGGEPQKTPKIRLHQNKPNFVHSLTTYSTTTAVIHSLGSHQVVSIAEKKWVWNEEA